MGPAIEAAVAPRAKTEFLAREWPKVVVALVMVGALVDYAGRCARVITADDPAELQVTTLASGIPHGTSYPLYVWLARAFVALPFGPIAFRFNLFSAVCGALSLGALAFATASLERRGEHRAWIAGAFAALLLAPSFTFTRVAIFTGMYTLHTLLALLALGLVARWTYGREGRDVEIALGILGAMLGNHVLTMALYPGVALALVWVVVVDRSQLRHVLRGVGWGALGFVVCDVGFFYVLWRHHVTFDHWAQIRAAPRFFDLPPDRVNSFWYAWWYEATCRQFRFDVVNATWEQRKEQLALALPRVCSELSPLAIVAAVGGFARLVWRSRVCAVMLAVVLATHVWLVTGYTATVKSDIYLLDVTAIIAGLAGLGAWSALEGVAAVIRRPYGAIVAAAGALALAWMHGKSRDAFAAHEATAGDPAALPIIREHQGPRPDEHDSHAMLDSARAIVAALPPRALVFVDWSAMFAMEYVALYERHDRDLELHDPYPYGVGHREFPVDHIARITDPARDRPVYFVLASRPPFIPGFTAVARAPEVIEVVKAR